MKTQGTILLFLLVQVSLYGQSSFLKILDEVETWAACKVTATPDLGFVMGNAINEPLESGKHGFYLTKFDSCGNVAWSNLYQNDDFALYFSDVAGLPDGDVVAMGLTGYNDLFLLKAGPDGQVLWLKTFDASDYDENYSLQVSGDRLMVFGNYLDAGNQTRNYLLVTDLDGQILWARSYFRSLSTGEALAVSDGGFLCRTGNMLYKLDGNGNLAWAQRYTDLDPRSCNISQPVELPDGFIFSVRHEKSDFQYLVKINAGGVPLWQSDLVPSHFSPSELCLGGNGNLYLLNALPAGYRETPGYLPMIVEFSPGGRILGQYQFNLGEFGRFLHPTVTNGPDETLIVAGSFYRVQNKDFMMKVKPEAEDWSCAGERFDDTQPNPIANLKYVAENTAAGAVAFDVSDSTQVQAVSYAVGGWAYCDPVFEEDFLEMDSSIVCVDTLTYRSPFESATYLWNDGSTAGERILTAPGFYQVDIRTCRKDYHLDIDLELGLCPCECYIPNAFSPNADGTNDLFQVFSTCGFIEYELRIFDRWGQLLFQNRDPETGWDGLIRGQRAPSGVYVYMLHYKWEIQPGKIWEKMATGTVAVLR